MPRDRAPDAKKNAIKPWLKKRWCLPGGPDAAFVAAMEDVLDVYGRPYDPRRVVVCVDEKSKQLVGDVYQPLPVAPGQVAREDAHYQRHGTANIFLAVEPLTGRRVIAATDRRTRLDFARFLRDLADVHYPDVEAILCVSDNLNIHGRASLYAAFAPEEAKRLADRFEWHPTPKRGSWLNIAELELSVLERQCLDRRIPNRPALAQEIQAWETSSPLRPIQWRFTVDKARIKLKSLYPAIQTG